MPLVYSAMTNEQVAVQENALQKVPRLCNLLEFTHVKEVLLPKLIHLFTNTKTLSVKVSCLVRRYANQICFHTLTSMLDAQSLAEVLLPVLNRVKTPEPAVMVASLAVYEVLAQKVDRKVKATTILPRLWVISMVGPVAHQCPTLSEAQFARFMRVTRDMGEQVERERRSCD